MPQKATRLSWLLSFLLGVSWGIMLVGSLGAFFLYLYSGIPFAIFAFFLGSIPGLLMMLFLEYIFLKAKN